MSETKQRAALLLREYDELRTRIRNVETQLNKAVATYGREQGMWGLGKDAFRTQINREDEDQLRQDEARIAAMYEQAAWEQAQR